MTHNSQSGRSLLQFGRAHFSQFNISLNPDEQEARRVEPSLKAQRSDFDKPSQVKSSILRLPQAKPSKKLQLQLQNALSRALRFCLKLAQDGSKL